MPKVVVVTGGSAGVGRATARLFAEKGWDVGLIARGPEGLDAARREIEARGRRALAVSADVADADAVESATRRIEETLGPIDVWINNAMATVFSPIRELAPEEIRRVTEVTYLGAVHGTLSALRRMERRGGVIVQVGSALAHRSIPLQAAYCAAKHAVRGFTESLRCELLHDRSPVRVTMVQLPALNTPQFGWGRARMPRQPQPVPPIYQPEVAARAIFWAARHPRREVNVGIMTSVAILAGHFFPGLVDRYLARTGYDSQQTRDPLPPDHADNLFLPVPGDPGAHGFFDRQASDRSPHLWYETHRRPIALGVLAGMVTAGFVSRSGARRRRTPRSRALLRLVGR